MRATFLRLSYAINKSPLLDFWKALCHFARATISIQDTAPVSLVLFPNIVSTTKAIFKKLPANS